MKFSFRHTDKVVGAFMLSAVFILLISLIFVLLNQKIFVKKHNYKTQFIDRVGLKTNTDIVFNGFVIGKLKDFNLNEKDIVDVDFYIFDEYYTRITVGSVLSKMSNPLSGSTVYFIKNYNSEIIVPEGSMIPSLDMEEGKSLLASGIIKPRVDAISNILANVDNLLKSINNDKNADANSIARILVNTADIIEKLKSDLFVFGEMMENFNTLSQDMKDADGLVQRLVDPEGVYMFNSLQKSLTELSNVMENFNNFSKFVNNQQKEIEVLMIDGKRTVDETRQVIEGVKNNPLIKGGIAPKKEQLPANSNLREWEDK